MPTKLKRVSMDTLPIGQIIRGHGRGVRISGRLERSFAFRKYIENHLKKWIFGVICFIRREMSRFTMSHGCVMMCVQKRKVTSISPQNVLYFNGT